MVRIFISYLSLVYIYCLQNTTENLLFNGCAVEPETYVAYKVGFDPFFSKLRLYFFTIISLAVFLMVTNLEFLYKIDNHFDE